ncbi:MAG TPA: extracellular solute-binding protein [Candidatus Paceibacterota bacterium]|nr:extracellular solute-binding protein [Candidatus Paceibacterota bacterium]
MNLNSFQTVVLLIFGGLLVVAILMFSGVIPGYKKASQSAGQTVVVWGTLPQNAARTALLETAEVQGVNFSFAYVEKDPQTFEADFVNALAKGTGPDLVLLPDHLVVRQRDKLTPVSYQSLPARDFRDRFVSSGDIYLSPEGSLSLPLLIDPLVMYINRDILTDAAVAQIPELWSEFVMPESNFTTKVSLVDVASNNIVRSAVSFGTANNVEHAKDIISLLMIQAGNPIIRLGDNGAQELVFGQSLGLADLPAVAALSFYTQFADPEKVSYTWNTAMPDAKEFFSSGRSAAYFGYASELAELKRKNPHLALDVAIVPQRTKAEQRTYGRILGVSIVKNSRRQASALQGALAISSKEGVKRLSAVAALPPARRDLLVAEPSDPFQIVLHRSALVSRAWLDPDPQETTAIFKRMIESVTIGKAKPTDAVVRATDEFARLMP